ncbi:MAG: CDP-alcohol phosphatidyltransferase family protein [Deltaproteobacteria bacterium]|nr:CDP-alcohol phosphatidyltransferase family protein [Deltaproteobacteria bacterium]MBW2134576.1 CDP-alcohol phosphatidyltransferase family protein [Deltaproteobacteria bacterium]
MVEEAVILMPEEKLNCLPSYLFAPVAGVPLLQRELFGLWRAGITSVTIMVPPAAQPDLERHLSQVLKLTENIKVISDWETLWAQTLNGTKDNPRLAVLANILADPRFLARLVNYPVPPGKLALGLMESPDPAQGNKDQERAKRISYPVILKDGLVTSLGFSDSANGLQAAGLVLFSPTAWQNWQHWQQGHKKPLDSFLSDPETPLFAYLSQQVRENRVLGVVSDPVYISAIHHDRDRAEATARLIAAADGSPLGDGRLETTLNRTMARKLLPWVLASSVTPNQITAASLLLGLVASLGFAVGTYEASLAAGLLLPLVMVLDCLDGMVARLKFQESGLGARLDLYGDTILNLIIFWGIAVGQYRASGHPLFLGLGLLLTLGYLACWWLLDIPEVRHWDPAHSPLGARLCPSKLKKAGKFLEEAVSRDFFYIILLGALINCLDYLFIGIAVGTNVFALFLFKRQRHGQV